MVVGKYSILGAYDSHCCDMTLVVGEVARGDRLITTENLGLRR